MCDEEKPRINVFCSLTATELVGVVGVGRRGGNRSFESTSSRNSLSGVEVDRLGRLPMREGRLLRIVECVLSLSWQVLATIILSRV